VDAVVVADELRDPGREGVGLLLAFVDPVVCVDE
jgi:hypothetical protein